MSRHRESGDGLDSDVLSPRLQQHQMVRQGRSFSGRERNCCFLNMGAVPAAIGQFANMSAASGLDYPDDGRAVAAVDWDHDGDLDLWISNRNAPRLRLMLNNTPSRNHWIALKLVGNGKTTNRDAIGARVEVVVRGARGEGKRTASNTRHPTLDTRHLPLIKTLRAGEGFIAQSTKWLHFGLGTNDEIEKVIVRWPNREEGNSRIEEFTELGVDGRYRLIQGSGKPQSAPAAARTVRLKPGEPKVPTASRTARVPIITMLTMPTLSMPKREFGEGQGKNSASTHDGKPLLINLWASWCTPCLQELVEFRDHEAQIRAAGIKVIVASVDGLGDDETDLAAATALLKRIKFPFGAITASEDLVTILQNYHDVLIGLQRPLPLPSSFLIDADNRLSVIYKGPLRVDDLLADVRHSQGTRAERSIRAAPLAGRTIDHPLVARMENILEADTQYRFARQLALQDLDDVAMRHAREALHHNPDFGLAHRLMAYLHRNKDNWSDVVVHLQKALENTPEDSRLHFSLGIAHWNLKSFAKAQEHLEEAVRLQPGHLSAQFDLALLHMQQGNAADAVKQYQLALQLNPEHVNGRNNLAWLLATHPDEVIRNGQESLEIATRLVAQSFGKNAVSLDLLAAAQAETGRFGEATATARRASELARSSGQEELADQIELRLEIYQRSEPYRERPESAASVP